MLASTDGNRGNMDTNATQRSWCVYIVMTLLEDKDADQLKQMVCSKVHWGKRGAERLALPKISPLLKKKAGHNKNPLLSKELKK